MVVELKPHQRKAVDELRNGCVLVGGVGTGKTPTSLAYFWERELGGTLNKFDSVKVPMDIYIFTTARKRNSLDWQEWAAQFCIGEERNASVYGIRLVVDSYNNIQKYEGISGCFVIFDEQRVVGSGAWSKSFVKIAKANRWIMLSATPGDIWEDYIPLFIANGFYKNRTEFKRRHCVYSYYGRYPKLERYLETDRLKKLRDSILVDMPYERHTKRHIHTVPVDYDKTIFEKVVKKRWHVYEDRPLKDVSELFSVMRKVVNSDNTRLTAVKELLTLHPRLIVFYNFDYELEQLRTLRNSELLTENPSNGASFQTCTSPMTSGPSSSSIETPTPVSSKPDSFGNQESLISSELQESLHPVGSSGSETETSRSLVRPSRSIQTTKEQTWKRSQREQTLTLADTTLSRPGGEKMKPKPAMHIASAATPKLVKSSGSSETISTTSTTTYGFTSPLVVAEWNGHKHEPVPDSERWLYLVQYVAGAEAWNCVETNAICFYSLTYSYKNFEQAQGRIDRLNTPYTDLEYYILLSKSPIDVAVSRSLKQKRNFNERDFGKRL